MKKILLSLSTLVVVASPTIVVASCSSSGSSFTPTTWSISDQEVGSLSGWKEFSDELKENAKDIAEAGEVSLDLTSVLNFALNSVKDFASQVVLKTTIKVKSSKGTKQLAGKYITGFFDHVMKSPDNTIDNDAKISLTDTSNFKLSALDDNGYAINGGDVVTGNDDKDLANFIKCWNALSPDTRTRAIEVYSESNFVNNTNK